MKNLLFSFIFIFFVSNLYAETAYKVGWIGPLTGGASKWGAYKSSIIATDEINANGGINGRRLKLVYEDSRCNSALAISAFKKLTSIDRVSFILGGHCSPESIAIAPLAERKKVIALAAITSSPKLSDMGDYIFRVTPISTKLADMLVPYAVKKDKVKKIALVYELTDYVIPVAERINKLFKNKGVMVTSDISFNPGEIDFSSILLKALKNKPEAIYLGVQSPDTALLLIKKLRELNFKQKIYGNEQFGGAFYSANSEEKAFLKNVIFAEAKCDFEREKLKKFASKYKEKYGEKDLPFGCYTSEAYDTVHLIAKAIAKCGGSSACVKDEFYKLKNYNGASSSITFNSKGDVDREYVLRKITSDKILSIN